MILGGCRICGRGGLTVSSRLSLKGTVLGKGWVVFRLGACASQGGEPPRYNGGLGFRVWGLGFGVRGLGFGD